MNDTETTGSDKKKMDANDLAFERTIMAESRTLMAWIRTAISMISFGFTLYKFFEETVAKVGGHQKFFTPRRVGMVMILLGLLSLLWALNEHKAVMKKLSGSYAGVSQSNSVWLARAILIFGIGLFLAAFFHQ